MIVAGNGDTQKPLSRRKYKPSSKLKIRALLKKNSIRLGRNLPALLFNFVMPSIQIILFCTCIGRDPKDVRVAVYNAEGPDTGFSKWFLDSIDNETITLVYHDTLESAIDAVKVGDCWAAMEFAANYTKALTERRNKAGDVDNGTLTASEIQVYQDMSNQVFAYTVRRKIIEAFQKFAEEIITLSGESLESVKLPISFEEPIYGEKDPTMTEFMAPGTIMNIAFFSTTALTALALVMERKEGLLERSLVAGVSTTEFVMSHILSQIGILGVQVAFMIYFSFYVFDIPSRGPLGWVFVAIYLQGVCGLMYGLMISAICTEEVTAVMIGIGSFFPCVLLGGMFWPIETISIKFMRYVGYSLPQTIPTDAMRSILSRGWDTSYPIVQYGFIVSAAWITFFLFMTILIFRRNK